MMIRKFLTVTVATVLLALGCAFPATANADARPHWRYALRGYGTELVTYRRQLHAFVVGNDHRVYHTWLTSRGWHSWQCLGGNVFSHVDSKVIGMDLLIWATGANRATYFNDYIPPHWSGWFMHWSRA